MSHHHDPVARNIVAKRFRKEVQGLASHPGGPHERLAAVYTEYLCDVAPDDVPSPLGPWPWLADLHGWLQQKNFGPRSVRLTDEAVATIAEEIVHAYRILAQSETAAAGHRDMMSS